MKSLLKKISKLNLITKIRNYTGIRPVALNNNNLTNNCTISDAFIWRTDNNFKTYFKYTDLLKLFFNKENSKIIVNFYDKKHNLIKQINNKNIELSNTIEINKDFLKGLEDYGVFYIFHQLDEEINSSIRNSCYTGFSLNDELPSFVHGNCPTLHMPIKNYNESDDKQTKDIVGLSLFQNKKYKIQNYFKNLSKLEIFLQNPTSKKIKIKINNFSFELNAKCSIIHDTSKLNTIEIVSNCYFLRPIIFCYKNQYIDVHHG